MKNNIIEFIRNLLIRTVLPLRKKREAFLSNLHFSIAFRITFNYMKLYFLYGSIFLLALSVLYLINESNYYKEMITDCTESIVESNEIDIELLNQCKLNGIEVKVVNESTGEILFNNITFSLTNKGLLLHKIYYSTKDTDNIIVVKEQEHITKENAVYAILYQYNMTQQYNAMINLLWKVVLLYTIIGIIITIRAKKENIKLLEPINDMSLMAKRLNVNNLDSARINVEGTKNELKDLAEVINQMLDRIETSYESQKQFVSDASHELRTPIAVIQGYANMLRRWGSKNEEVLNESIEAINNESKSMQDLVEKLLFLSRHDKKTLRLDKKRFNAGYVVDELVKETKMVAKNREVVAPIIQDVKVYGDPQALKQALRVFIDNAIKYTEDGDEISISCENKDGDCVIVVSDTGIGMTKKDMDNIFQRFYRSDVVRNHNISGHGLGLSIAKLIILAHVGRIKVRSQFTVGTSFTVTIPKRNR